MATAVEPDRPSVELTTSWVVQFFLSPSSADPPPPPEDRASASRKHRRAGSSEKGEDEEGSGGGAEPSEHSTPEPLLWAYFATVLVYGAVDLALRYAPWPRLRRLYRSAPEWAVALLLVLLLFDQTLSVLREVAVGLYWLDHAREEEEEDEKGANKTQKREEDAAKDGQQSSSSDATLASPPVAVAALPPPPGCLDKTGRFAVLEERGDPGAPLDRLVMLRPIWLTREFFRFLAEEEQEKRQQKCRNEEGGQPRDPSLPCPSPDDGEGPAETVARFLELRPFFGRRDNRRRGDAGGPRVRSRDNPGGGAAGAASSGARLANYRYFLDTQEWLLLLAGATRLDGTVDTGLIRELEERGHREVREVRDRARDLPRALLERFQLRSCAACGREGDGAGHDADGGGGAGARVAGKKRRAPTTILSTCSGCRSFAYCGPLCQQRHWADGHRLVCLKRKDW
jgi:hypothetical protein